MQGRAAGRLARQFLSSFDHASEPLFGWSDFASIGLLYPFCISNNLPAYRQFLFYLCFFDNNLRLCIRYTFSISYHVVTSRSSEKYLVPPSTLDWPPGVAVSAPIAVSFAIKPTPRLRAFSPAVPSVEPEPRHHYGPDRNRQWIVLCPSRRLIRRKR